LEITRKTAIITITATPALPMIFSKRVGSGCEPATSGPVCGMADELD
jgi:hypothetical protein